MIQVSQCPSHSFGPTLSSLQITYGFNGGFVFEHSVDELESKSTVSESLRTVVKNIPMEDLHEVVPLKVDGEAFDISIFFAERKIWQISNGGEYNVETSGVFEPDFLCRDAVHQILWGHHPGETARELHGSCTYVKCFKLPKR